MSCFIWIASYPKSGNTWMRLFLATLQGEGADVDLDRMDGTASIAVSRAELQRDLDICLADMSREEISDLRPLAYRGRAKAATRPIFLKVHDHYALTASGDAMFPPDVTAGCLHIVRDPRDVCISLAAHNGVSIDRAIKQMGRPSYITGKKRNQTPENRGTWSVHAESWLAAPIRRLTLRYEDLLADPIARFTDVARFCGLSDALLDIAKAVELTDFQRLAAKEAEQGFSERPEHMERFFRSGAAGQWRETLSSEQIARIESDHKHAMLKLGYALVSER